MEASALKSKVRVAVMTTLLRLYHAGVLPETATRRLFHVLRLPGVRRYKGVTQAGKQAPSAYSRGSVE